MAEGGFKSMLLPTTANDYLLTTNLTMGIWKWIEAYIDLGILKNRKSNSHFLYGCGIRFNILPDYFEIFFPLYSSNGFEPTQSRYATKIRFIFTPRLRTLSSLFTRKWF